MRSMMRRRSKGSYNALFLILGLQLVFFLYQLTFLEPQQHANSNHVHQDQQRASKEAYFVSRNKNGNNNNNNKKLTGLGDRNDQQQQQQQHEEEHKPDESQRHGAALTKEQKRVRRLQRQQQKQRAKWWGNNSNSTTTADDFQHLPSPESNYFTLAQQLYPGFPLIPELQPLNIMNQYINTHSQQYLQQLWNECHATTTTSTKTTTTSAVCHAKLQELQFVVGYYSCPWEAGNRLHKFMNAMIYAIVTKRIFLWDYFDETSCVVEEEELTPGTCSHFLNTREDCATTLVLANWIPSWTEWSVKLNLTRTKDDNYDDDHHHHYDDNNNNDTSTTTRNVRNTSTTKIPFIQRVCGIGSNPFCHDELAFPMDASPTTTTITTHGGSSRKKDAPNNNKNTTTTTSRLSSLPRVIRIGQQNTLEPGVVLSNLNHGVTRRMFVKPSSLHTLLQLFRQGHYFTYGMLFEALFTLHPSLFTDTKATIMTSSHNDENHNKRDSTTSNTTTTTPVSSLVMRDLLNAKHADTYFLHSRHPPNRGNATNIWLEQECMQLLLSSSSLNHPNQTMQQQQQQQQESTESHSPELDHRPCRVVIMTDRKETRPLLQQALLKYNCTSIMVAHDIDDDDDDASISKSNQSKNQNINTTSHKIKSSISTPAFRSEHGLYAGRGYFQDLTLVIQTRTGFLAPHLALREGKGIRTSSGIPREIIEFRRVLEAQSWKDLTSSSSSSSSSSSVLGYQECIGFAQDKS